VLAWVFFKAETFTGAIGMLRGMAGSGGVSLPMRLQAALGALPLPGLKFEGLFVGNETLMGLGAGRFAILLAAAAAIVWCLPNTQELFLHGLAGRDTTRGLSWKASRAWGVAVGVALAVCIMDMQHVSEFLYFRF